MKAGIRNNVIRLLAPLVISMSELEKGLSILEEAVKETAVEMGVKWLDMSS